MNEYKVPGDGTLITSLAISGRDLYIFTGRYVKTVDGTKQFSTNPYDGKIYIYRDVVDGGFCDEPVY